MGPTLRQQHTADLRIGSLAILIARAPKCLLIGLRIRRVEERPIDGHEPIPTKEGGWHRCPVGNQQTALCHQCLQRLTSQFLAPSAYPSLAQLPLSLTRMQITELADQFLPDQTLVQPTPQPHPDEQPDQTQLACLPHSPFFLRPRLTLLNASLDDFFGIHLFDQGQIHLFTDLVIHFQLPSSLHQKAPCVFSFLVACQIWSFLVLSFPRLGLSEMY